MKKILSAAKICVVLLLAAALCCSCIPYNGLRPTDFPNTRWKCEAPNIWFDVGEISLCGELGKDYDAEGIWITENGESVAIAVLFDYVDGVAIRTLNGDGRVFFGKCDFGKERMTVTPNERRGDTLWGGKYETITFEKTSIGG